MTGDAMNNDSNLALSPAAQAEKTERGNARYRAHHSLLSISSGDLWSGVDIRRGGDVTLFYPSFKVKLEGEEVIAAFGTLIRQSAPLRDTGYRVARDIARDDLGRCFLVYDRPEGQPLSLLLRERKTLDLNTALSVMIQLCELLHRAHEISLFPVTITAQNIVISPRPHGTLQVSFIDLALDRRPLSQWTTPPPVELTSPPPAQLTQERDRRHFAVYLCASLLHRLVFGVEPKGPTDSDEARVWPALPHQGRELDSRLEACLHTILLKGLHVQPTQRFPRISAHQRALLGLRQLTAVSSPAFELLASTQARLGRRTGALNLSAPRPGVERAVKAREKIHQILEERDAQLTLEDVLREAEAGS